MRFSRSHLGKGRKVLLLFMGLLACCCHSVVFLLFSFYTVTACAISITNVILLLPVSSVHFSFYCPFRFQMMQKWLLSCQMPHYLSNITRKVTSKGGHQHLF